MTRSLNVQDWRQHKEQTGEFLHIYVDGVDVTKDSFFVSIDEDGVYGEVHRYKRNAEGVRYLVENQSVAREILVGAVEIRPGDPFNV